MQFDITTILSALSGPAPSSTPYILGVALLGLITGSFFNVVIYRICAQYDGANPKELNTSKPAKSFCPTCKKDLTWKENIPLLSYIIQQGKCSGCKSPIAITYPAVELAGLAAALGAWVISPTLSIAISTWILLGLLICCGVIDAKTKKIPNKITVPGTIVLLGLSFLPGNIDPAASLIGAGAIFLLMYGLVELGKHLFGKRTIRLKEPQEVLWKNGGLTIREPGLTMEESETMVGQDLPFIRSTDQIILEGSLIQNGTASHKIGFGPREPAEITGMMKQITYPREAMGMGDAKLLLMAGAAGGFQYAVNGLAIGAVSAIVFVIALRFAAKFQKKNAPGLIAFGPWIAFGCAIALVWPN